MSSRALTAPCLRRDASFQRDFRSGRTVPLDTAINADIVLTDLDIVNCSSPVFRAAVTRYGNAESRCNGDDTGRDTEIPVDASGETFTVEVYDARPYWSYGTYTLRVSLSRIDASAPGGNVELASASTRFLMSRYLVPGEAIAPPPTPGTQARMDPDPTTLNMGVGQWYRFRVRSNVLLYLNDHVGVVAYGTDHGSDHFASLPGMTAEPPTTTTVEACQNPNSVNWRRAIHQGLWITPCMAGDAGMYVRHETDAVAPLWSYEFRTLLAPGNDDDSSPTRSVSDASATEADAVEFWGTPNVGFGPADTVRDWRVGWRLTPAGVGVGVSLDLDATRREAVVDAAWVPEHELMLCGGLQW